jgi:uncharacterized membrane protein YqjE
MIATFLFYLEEMMAALILFTAFFLVASGAVLILFLLDQAYKLAFEWAETQLKSFGRFALRLHQSRYSPNESTASQTLRLAEFAGRIELHR